MEDTIIELAQSFEVESFCYFHAFQTYNGVLGVQIFDHFIALSKLIEQYSPQTSNTIRSDHKKYSNNIHAKFYGIKDLMITKLINKSSVGLEKSQNCIKLQNPLHITICNNYKQSAKIDLKELGGTTIIITQSNDQILKLWDLSKILNNFLNGGEQNISARNQQIVGDIDIAYKSIYKWDLYFRYRKLMIKQFLKNYQTLNTLISLDFKLNKKLSKNLTIQSKNNEVMRHDKIPLQKDIYLKRSNRLSTSLDIRRRRRKLNRKRGNKMNNSNDKANLNGNSLWQYNVRL